MLDGFSSGAGERVKPYAPACDRNREPILEVLRVHLKDRRHVLEIGSGTGQHAVYFAAAMPWVTWLCSDQAQHLPGIRLWLDEAALSNTPAPIALDVRGPWPVARWDAVFSANTLHIIGWSGVEALFAGLDAALAEDAVLALYGPFNYGGAYTSDSNREFDDWLRARDPLSRIRDFETVDALARGIGLRLVADAAMPANNRCLVWRRERAGL
jgi:cyclopropane fatty-acyl-phospholipid synthase-like methyltransferase